ncbi:hypothetical protein ACJJTC_000609 [Scirpophaga incertulas]
MLRYLNENDIEKTLPIFSIPDDGSDDVFESDEGEEFNKSDTSTIALCSQLDKSQPEEPLIVQSSPPLEQELTDESECKDESWGKDLWTSRPEPDPGLRVNEVVGVMPVKRIKKKLEALHLNYDSQQPNREDAKFYKLYKIRPLLVNHLMYSIVETKILSKLLNSERNYNFFTSLCKT